MLVKLIIKIRSYGIRVGVAGDWCTYKEFGHIQGESRDTEGRRHGKTEAEIGMIRQGIASSQKLGEKQGNILLQHLQRECGPADTLILGF